MECRGLDDEDCIKVKKQTSERRGRTAFRLFVFASLVMVSVMRVVPEDDKEKYGNKHGVEEHHERILRHAQIRLEILSDKHEKQIRRQRG